MNEESKPPFTDVVRSWFRLKGLRAEISKDSIEVYDKRNNLIFSKQSNSFFRSSHLESFANQVAKKMGFTNDLDAYRKHIYGIK